MSIGTSPIPGANYPVGIAYVALPVDIDRSRYIALCFKTCTVCLRDENGTFYNRVSISEKNLQELDFPDTPEQLGTPVLYINEPIKNQIVIVTTFNWPDQLPDLKQGQFRQCKRFQESYVEVSGSAKENRISLIINSQEKGEICVNIVSDNKTGKYSLDIQGEVSIVATNNIVLESQKRIIISTEDEKAVSKFEQTTTENKFVGEKFTINKGLEPMLKGTTTKSFLEKLVTLLSQSTVSVNGTPMPLLNSQQISQLLQETEGILSKMAFLE